MVVHFTRSPISFAHAPAVLISIPYNRFFYPRSITVLTVSRSSHNMTILRFIHNRPYAFLLHIRSISHPVTPLVHLSVLISATRVLFSCPPPNTLVPYNITDRNLPFSLVGILLSHKTPDAILPIVPLAKCRTLIASAGAEFRNVVPGPPFLTVKRTSSVSRPSGRVFPPRSSRSITGERN